MKEAPDARRLRARILNVLEMCNLPDAEKNHVCKGASRTTDDKCRCAKLSPAPLSQGTKMFVIYVLHIALQDLDRLLHFVLVGGGPTGVECAAELHDLIEDEVKEFFPHLASKCVASIALSHERLVAAVLQAGTFGNICLQYRMKMPVAARTAHKL